MAETFETCLAGLPQGFQADPPLMRRAARASLRFRIDVEDAVFLLQLDQGQLSGPEPVTGPMVDSDFTLRASRETWLTHWRAIPPPEFHDIFAMTRAGHLRIDGDFRPLMVHLQVVKDVLALPRRRT